ncbi:hypothetical protein M9H77_26352 [Catharanthus roseus]|uniref:Uncharacterized protein n=1 Tax=Catharanthus roseus TaxID=4058 RepID=A0ACC0AAA5_CATRO|nr:hypothetical protein M9H77_26352 [Catharanthus roseus]
MKSTNVNALKEKLKVTPNSFLDPNLTGLAHEGGESSGLSMSKKGFKVAPKNVSLCSSKTSTRRAPNQTKRAKEVVVRPVMSKKSWARQKPPLGHTPISAKQPNNVDSRHPQHAAQVAQHQCSIEGLFGRRFGQCGSEIERSPFKPKCSS